MATTLSSHAASCYQKLQTRCNAIEIVRNREFRDQSLIKKVHYYASGLLLVTGVALAIASIPMAICFSATYLIAGAVGALAAYIALKTGDRFGALAPEERLLTTSIKILGFNRSPLPDASVLKFARERIYKKGSHSSASLISFFGGKECLKKCAHSIPLTAKEDQRLSAGLGPLFAVHDYSLLLESIQHAALNRLDLLKANTKALKETLPNNQAHPSYRSVKLSILAHTLINPSKEFLERMQQAFASKNGKPTFALSALDKAYEIAKSS